MGLAMCDEFTRENLTRRIGRSITADDAVAALDEAYAKRGAPEFIRCDNGPDLMAMAIRDWCRFMGTGTAYIEPGSLWENPYVESFNEELRDELFAREVFDSVMEARILFDDWGDVYNQHRPTARSVALHPPSSPQSGTRESRAQTRYHQPPRPPTVAALPPRNPHRGLIWTPFPGLGL
jgi:putative transposase